ncbi:hypothetical protein NIES3585_12800 [Nodularia sp. NIES-3585]|nr:hypothetical protein NIES3585_12800 [Nodularia sp. NIES-3585]
MASGAMPLGLSIANFRTNNLVTVGSRDNNKEQCHKLWQCQTIVDSLIRNLMSKARGFLDTKVLVNNT